MSVLRLLCALAGGGFGPQGRHPATSLGIMELSGSLMILF